MKNIFKILLLFLFVSTFTYSQTDSIKTTLSEIIISATKSETPFYAIGSSVSVITAGTIQKKQLKTVVEVLREIPGVSVSQLGGPGKMTNVSIRGANTNHTLVILDGVKMNDPSSPSNAFDFSALNARDVEKIEIVRGSQSTLYGSDAIGGIINIITKKGSEKSNYSFEGEGGSNNYFRSSLSSLGSLGQLKYFVNVSKAGSDGVSAANSIYGNKEKDGFNNTAVSGKLDYSFSNQISVGLMYKYLKANADLDQNEKLGDDPNFTYKQEEQLWKIYFGSALFEGMWNQTISASFIKRLSNNLDLEDVAHPNMSSDAYNYGTRIKIDWENNLFLLKNNTITFGLETENESARTSYVSNSVWGLYESLFPVESAITSGVFLQDQFNYDNSIFLTMGVRYDKHQKFGSITTYRIAPVYFIKETNTKLKFSYGNGFKAPSLFYLFDPSFGNPDLKPEKSKGWDLGFDQYFDNQKVFFGVTYFQLSIDNMFGFDSNFKTINIAKAKSNGVEITSGISFNNSLSFNANYTFLETKDAYDKSEDYNLPLLRRPKHQFNFSTNYNLNDYLNFNFSLKYVGSRYDKDFNTYPVSRIKLADYTLLNFGVSYKLFSNISINARMENILDKKYEEVLYYGTLGRSLYAGLNLNL